MTDDDTATDIATRLAPLLPALRELDARAEDEPGFPAALLERLAPAGLWGWAIPQAFGGRPLDDAGLLAAYEAIARGSLTAALLVTQRDGAVDLVVRGDNDGLRQRLLPAWARGERFTSIGISQLTTSLGTRPKMTARADGDAFVLDGVMPWVSGACACDEIVTGAVLDDGRQILAVVPCDAPGVTIDPPLELMALQASCTSRVRCEQVRIGREWIVRGPAPRVLDRRTPVKPLTVTAVGLGLAARIVDELRPLLEAAPNALAEPVRPRIAQLDALRRRFRDLAARLGSSAGETPAAPLRIEINALLTRLSVALLSLSKGSGYVRGRPAEKLLREAMFFHVWSAPDSIRGATLAELM